MRSGAASLNLIMYFIALLAVTGKPSRRVGGQGVLKRKALSLRLQLPREKIALSLIC